MDIQKVQYRFNKFVDGTKEALCAVRELTIIDRELATAIFNISSFDAHFFEELGESAVIEAAHKNTQLFLISMPKESELKQALLSEVITSLPFADDNVKQAALRFKYAQRSCLLQVKHLIDINLDLVKLIVGISEEDARLIEKLNEETLMDLADRYSWILTLNYQRRKNIFFETLERRSFPRHMVESTILY
jgi:hypothetical protein